MILDKLYLQYQSGKKLRFLSKLGDAAGRALIGTPSDLGMEGLRPDLEGQFYFDRVDRLAPENKSDFQKWSLAAIEPNIKRHSLLPDVAKGVFYSGLIVIILLMTAAWTIKTTKQGFVSISRQASSWRNEEQVNEKPLEDCNAIVEKLVSGVISPVDITPEIKERCEQIN